VSESDRAEVVVCGAGIAGLAVAFQLAVRHGVRDVLIVDERPPLSLTSDKSTECYRNWWPDAPMMTLMNRSIELLDELTDATGNAFALNRNGYVYLTAEAEGERALRVSAEAISKLGAGELRVHDRGSADAVPPVAWERPDPGPAGADLILGSERIRATFPWVAPDTRAALWARRCGWLSAQQMGMYWLEQARAAGARLVAGRVSGVELVNGRVCAVEIEQDGRRRRVATSRFVNAAGPFSPDVARLVGVELPIFHELHRKVFFDDHLGRLPREAPLVIWNDPVTVDWSDEELEGLLASEATRRLVGTIPAGVHFRPEGGAGSRSAILLWNYHVEPVERRFPIPDDPLHVQVVVRGIARAIPAFATYNDTGRRPYVDGGYYTKTRENRPLIGPCGPEGSYMIVALSGFGIMTSPAASELLAAYVTGGDDLPGWASAFRLDRYQDRAYLRAIERLDQGQL